MTGRDGDALYRRNESAPRSVWVLVWPDGTTGATYQSFEAVAEHIPAVVVRYDLAEVTPIGTQVAPVGTQVAPVGSSVAAPIGSSVAAPIGVGVAPTSPPSDAPEPSTVPGLQSGSLAVPAVEAGDHGDLLDPRLRRWTADPDTGCWLWDGSKRKNGYGRGIRGGLAHRQIYQQLVGPIPENLQCDHLCRVRHCVNPAHIEIVTNRENQRRGLWGPAMKTHCIHGHPFDEANTRWRGTKRCCRECPRIGRRRRAAAQREARDAEFLRRFITGADFDPFGVER